MADPQNFMTWVCDPARTNDELFTVELLLEGTRGRMGWPFPEEDRSLEAKMERMRERKLNPKYRPSILRDELRALAECTETLTHFRSQGDYDRAVRDLHALTFFPAIIDVNLSGSDVSDLSPLRALTKLQRLSIGEYGDFHGSQPLSFAECGEMRDLVHLHLALRHPWPDLRGLATWPALREIIFNGNILAFEEVQELPAARIVALKHWPSERVPVRDLKKLPAMPQVKQLTVHAATVLEGIERYPSAVNVNIEGIFRDLTPLATMEKITALTLTGEHFSDLAPLARMPRLRELHLIRERPIDLAPLADCPQLRRVSMERCTMMRTEVAALNAGLLPEALDFQAETPRPLPPLKFFSIGKENEAGREFFRQRELAQTQEREKFYDGDAAFAKAEKRAFSALLQARLDALLGKGWGLMRDDFHFITFKRFADTMRVRDIVQMLREESARSRFPWTFHVIVEPHGDMSEELEEMKAREAQAAESDGDYLARYYEPETVLRENEEQRRARQERYELLQREHQMQLRDDDGIDPALLHSAQEELEPPADEDVDDDQPLTPADNDDLGEGGVALAPPPPAPPETKDLGQELMFYLEVNEDCIVAMGHWADAAAYNLGQKPVEWMPNETSASTL